MQQQRPVRVLVAGLENRDNQFTRRLAKEYGCEVFWTSVDERRYEREVDIGIVVRAQINSKKFQEIKDLFKQNKRPLLVARDNFSDIKNAFDDFLYRRGLHLNAKQMPLPKPGHQKQPFNSSFSSLKELKPNDEKPIDVAPVPKAQNKLRDILKVVKECADARMSAHDTVVMLGEFKKSSGNSYDEQDVYNFRSRLRKEGALDETPIIAEEIKPPPPPPKIEAKPAQLELKPEPPPPAPAPIGFDPLSLIGEVLKSEQLPQEEKLKLIQKIQAGDVKAAIYTQCDLHDDGKTMRVRKINFADLNDITEVWLRGAEAALVLENLAAINNFVTKGSL